MLTFHPLFAEMIILYFCRRFEIFVSAFLVFASQDQTSKIFECNRIFVKLRN